MTDERFEISRRKTLAALGTIGVASAGAGLGTSAYFSDQETFINNELTAGELDLTVDWEEHYSVWSDDEATAAGDVVMTEGDPTNIPTGYVGLPDPNYPMIAIPSGNLDAYMDATSIEAYPDEGNDGMQDPIPASPGDFPYTDNNGNTYGDICEYLANVGDDDPGLSSDLRTEGTFNGQTTNAGDPLINLTDVKPGDFGELTLSTHLCDNDGYLWMNGELLENAENDVTEPEADDPDENGGEPGELGDLIRVSAWYDDGDNVLEDTETMIVENAPLTSFLGALGTGNGVPLSPGGFLPVDTLECTDTVVATIAENDANGLDVGDSTTISQPTSGDDLTIEIDDETTTGGRNRVAFSGDFPAASQADVGDYLGVCEVTIVGTNGQVTRDYGDGGCVRSSQLLPVAADVGTVTELQFKLCYAQQAVERECFEASTTYNFGIAWWLPVDHGNEVQTDSVKFDLGFYTEQCRHNDGTGMNNEGVDPEETDA